ncbi:MAG: hypothetical protein ACW96U_13180 [Candidatus Heimdallarchaeaceae archaeon]
MRKYYATIIGIMIITIGSLSGCLYDNYEIRSNLMYYANYEEVLDFDGICEVFSLHNVSFEKDEEYINFSFGKGVNNDSLDFTKGAVRKYGYEVTVQTTKPHSELWITLNESEYPYIKKTGDYKKKLESRKPILEKSMDYLTSLVYDATGLKPDIKKFEYGNIQI